MTLDELLDKYVSDYTGSEISPGFFREILSNFITDLADVESEPDEDVGDLSRER